MRDSCKDCGSTTRKLSPPGPRCATCKRAFRAGQQKRARDKRYQALYGITLAIYNKLLAFQGGKCAGCQRATGRTKALAVDHDHRLGSGEHTVRGILCGPCNQTLGQARDDPEYFRRLIAYLENPPYKRMKEQDSDPRGNLRPSRRQDHR